MELSESSHRHHSTSAATAATDSLSPPPPRRSICQNCSRPQPVCLCKFLPPQPIPTKTQIIILQHPHEAQHKLSTTPIIGKCLLNTTTIINRRLRRGLSDLLDQSPPAIYLFPPTNSSPAVNLSDLKPSNSISISNSNRNSSSPDLVLIVFDGTWKHAKEMVQSSEGFLSQFATRVCLDFDESVEGGSIFDSELILRKEPCGGCVSTMEAVARCLGVIEQDGFEIENKLIRVLREMVKLQAGFLKPMKPRPKLLKKKKKKQEKNEGEAI